MESSFWLSSVRLSFKWGTSCLGRDKIFEIFQLFSRIFISLSKYKHTLKLVPTITYVSRIISHSDGWKSIINEKFTSGLKFLFCSVFNCIILFSIILQIDQSLKWINIPVDTSLRLVQMSYLAIIKLQFET